MPLDNAKMVKQHVQHLYKIFGWNWWFNDFWWL